MKYRTHALLRAHLCAAHTGLCSEGAAGAEKESARCTPNCKCCCKRADMRHVLQSCLSIVSAPLGTKVPSSAPPRANGSVPVVHAAISQQVVLVVPVVGLEKLCSDIENICLTTKTATGPAAFCAEEETPATQQSTVEIALQFEDILDGDLAAEEGVEAHPYVKSQIDMCSADGQEEERAHDEEHNTDNDAEMDELMQGVTSLIMADDKTAEEEVEAEGEHDDAEGPKVAMKDGKEEGNAQGKCESGDEDVLNSSLYKQMDDTPPSTFQEARAKIQVRIYLYIHIHVSH